MIQLIGSELYQWELGRQVKLNAPNLEVIPELHFIDYKSPNCLVVKHKMVDGEIIYDIPNILLQQTRGVFVYIVKKTEGCKEVIGTKNFKIKPKQKSPDYVYTETEIKSYEALEERITALENGSGTGGNVDLSEIEDDIENLQLDAAIMSGELDELETTVGQLSEDKADKENTYTKAEVDEIVQNLPNGEGGANEKWELIVEHTIEQKTNTILFTEDVNGNPFNLKKLFVYVKIIANTEDENASNAYLKINTDSTISRGDQNALAHAFATCPKSTEEYCKAYVILEKFGDIVAINESRKSSNHTTVKDNLVNSHDYSNSALLHKNENGFHKKIDQINLISHSNRIGAGSTIVAYGIRESEV